ncbi:MAG: LPS assembly lipoprotein LptE [Candidatus Spyradenecus sp.]
MRYFGWMAGACAAVAMVCTGCAGYQLGSPVPQELRTIHVPAFENRTEYPMVGAMAAQQLMDAIIEDGTFTLTTYDRARLRVQAIATGISSSSVRYDRESTMIPDEYIVTLKVQLYVFDRVTGETYINGKTFSASDTVLTRGEFQTGVTDALPRISRKLAQKLLTALHTLQPAADEPELTLDEAAAALEGESAEAPEPISYFGTEESDIEKQEEAELPPEATSPAK